MTKVRKGQEEIVGFVLIVVLVAIVILVFLGLMIRNSNSENEKKSSDIYNFISSYLVYTTNCTRDASNNFYDMGDLIQKCYADREFSCYNEEEGCQILNRTTKSIVEASWKVGADDKYKGYIFNITHTSNFTQTGEEVLSINKGECLGNKVGSEEPIPIRGGELIVSFKACY